VEEPERFVDRHLEDGSDVAAAVVHAEHLRAEAPALAMVAAHEDVGHEVHLDLQPAHAFAGFATPARSVEAERRRVELGEARRGRRREQGAHVGQPLHVGERIGARRAADRRLVDEDDAVHEVGAPQLVVAAARARDRAPSGARVLRTALPRPACSCRCRSRR
jgi:hypothetical protein